MSGAREPVLLHPRLPRVPHQPQQHPAVRRPSSSPPSGSDPSKPPKAPSPNSPSTCTAPPRTPRRHPGLATAPQHHRRNHLDRHLTHALSPRLTSGPNIDHEERDDHIVEDHGVGQARYDLHQSPQRQRSLAKLVAHGNNKVTITVGTSDRQRRRARPQRRADSSRPWSTSPTPIATQIDRMHESRRVFVRRWVVRRAHSCHADGSACGGPSRSER